MTAGNRPRLALNLVIGLVAGVLSALPAQAGVWTTKHNLSVSGPGTIKASFENRVCIFCHVPHNANPAVPLWGHVVNSGTYVVYASSTLRGTSGQPNGSSKQCLACHDGAVAVGAVVPSRAYPTGAVIALSGTSGGYMPAGSRNLGTDLSNDHPVSLLPATGGGADPEIVTSPPVGSRVNYDKSGRVQCTSCHDPHDDTNGKFLVQPNVEGGFGSQICIVCHSKLNWTVSSHRNSENLFGASVVKEQGCDICHKPHFPPVATRLLAGSEEGLCNTCHNGSTALTPAIKNVTGEFAKAYKHPADTVSVKHDAAETFSETNDPLKRHAECADCHNPHSAQAGGHTPGSSKIGAALLGTWGMKPIYGATPWTEPVSWQKVTFTDTTGADMLEAYLCFKCHKTLATAFNPANPSYHAVVGDSKADPAYSGAYLNGWNALSRMTCTDCHTSDNSGVKGPHGSSFALNAHPEPTLNFAIQNDSIIAFADYIRGGGHGPTGASPHWTNRGTGGTYDGYGNPRNSDDDLCFRCHNRRVYGHPTDNTYYYDATKTGYRSPITAENLHLRHMRGRACTTCHVVHGSNKPHLLAFGSDDFDLNSRLNYSGPAPAGGQWTYISCHGGSYTGC